MTRFLSDPQTSNDTTKMYTLLLTRKTNIRATTNYVREYTSPLLVKTTLETIFEIITKKTSAALKARNFTRERNGSNYKMNGLLKEKFILLGGDVLNACIEPQFRNLAMSVVIASTLATQSGRNASKPFVRNWTREMVRLVIRTMFKSLTLRNRQTREVVRLVTSMMFKTPTCAIHVTVQSAVTLPGFGTCCWVLMTLARTANRIVCRPFISFNWKASVNEFNLSTSGQVCRTLRHLLLILAPDIYFIHPFPSPQPFPLLAIFQSLIPNQQIRLPPEGTPYYHPFMLLPQHPPLQPMPIFDETFSIQAIKSRGDVRGVNDTWLGRS